MIARPVTSGRKSCFHALLTPVLSHWKLLLFWPVFGLLFGLAERGNVIHNFRPVFCALDAEIPFCEWFLIPYLFWFVFLGGMVVYSLLWDERAFCRMMYFTILTYGVTLAIYFLFPSCQQLRPVTFPRDNVLTRFLAAYYRFDTNTNVCPSLHVCGAVAVVAGAWNSHRFSRPGWRAAFLTVAALICLSTVFLKQHSVLDVAAGLAVCVPGWVVSGRMAQQSENTTEKNGNFQKIPLFRG